MEEECQMIGRRVSVVVPIFKLRGRGCNELWAYRGVKLLEHAMKIVEKVQERRL